MQKRKSTNIRGCDVSHWQGEVNWEKVKAGGLSFVYIKATEGQSFIDPLFEANIQGAKAAGLYVGAYHFARFQKKQDAIQEARHFFTTIKPHVLDLPPVLDLETNQGQAGEILSQNAFLFMETLHHLTNVTPMIYTSTQFAKQHLAQTLKNYLLWIAHFGQNQPGENGIWEKWTVFQYTDKGNVPGIKGAVDLDEWEGTDFQSRVVEPVKKRSDFTSPSSHLIHPAPTYKIQKGDTFWNLESQFGWQHGLLQALNPNLNPRRLRIGQSIKVPKQDR